MLRQRLVTAIESSGRPGARTRIERRPGGAFGPTLLAIGEKRQNLQRLVLYHAARFLERLRHFRDDGAGGCGWIACLRDGAAHHEVVRACAQSVAGSSSARLIVARDGLSALRPDAWADNREPIPEGRLKVARLQRRGNHAIEAGVRRDPRA